jgi:hypothetical protein
MEVSKMTINIINMKFNIKFYLILTLLLSIISRSYVALVYEINWDEFYYLSFIYQYLEQQPIDVLQTFHVHLFSWLNLVSYNEVNQIIVARFIMLILQLGTGYFIYSISRRYTDSSSALFAVVCYFSFSYVLKMGASFRTDPIATFCLLFCLNFLLKQKPTSIHSIFSGLFAALSIIITIKSNIYIPTFILISFFTFLDKQSNLKIKIIHITFYISIITFYVILYYFHSHTISTTDLQDNTVSALNSAQKTLNGNELFPRLNYFIQSIKSNLIYWIIFTISLIELTKQSINFNLNSLKLLALVVPLLTIVIYRNAYPYFYPFILASASIICSISWNFLYETFRSFKIHIGLIFLISINIVNQGFIIPHYKNSSYQYQFIETIHKIFPKSTNYLDRCSMISSYNKQGFFMSTWGIESYLENEVRIINKIIKTTPPLFIINNSPLLDIDNRSNGYYSLFEEDFLAIKDNYISFWNQLYVIGKIINLDDGEFEILIPGEYRLKSDFGVIINDDFLLPNNDIYLDIGKYKAKSVSNSKDFKLIWSQVSDQTIKEIPIKPLFTGF